MAAAVSNQWLDGDKTKPLFGPPDYSSSYSQRCLALYSENGNEHKFKNHTMVRSQSVGGIPQQATKPSHPSCVADLLGILDKQSGRKDERSTIMDKSFEAQIAHMSGKVRSQTVSAIPHDTVRHDHRGGMSDLFGHLDKQCADRRKDHRRARESEQAYDAMQLAHSASLKDPPEKFSWTYTDAPGFFQNPMPIEKGGASTMDKVDHMMGIYPVKEFKPPHSEFNVPGMWNPHATNDRECQLDYLGHPQREWSDKYIETMGANERMYFERRNKRLEEIAAAEKHDAHLNAQGYHKKAQVIAKAGDHSALKRTKAPWNTQAVTTHVYFSEYDKSKPGDHEYVTGLGKYIEQPVRATSFKRDFILGDPSRTTSWKPPAAGKVHGTRVLHDKAQELLCPTGCPSLSPTGSAKKLPGAQSSLFQNTKTATRDYTKGGSS